MSDVTPPPARSVCPFSRVVYARAILLFAVDSMPRMVLLSHVNSAFRETLQSFLNVAADGNDCLRRVATCAWAKTGFERGRLLDPRLWLLDRAGSNGAPPALRPHVPWWPLAATAPAHAFYYALCDSRPAAQLELIASLLVERARSASLSVAAASAAASGGVGRFSSSSIAAAACYTFEDVALWQSAIPACPGFDGAAFFMRLGPAAVRASRGDKRDEDFFHCEKLLHSCIIHEQYGVLHVLLAWPHFAQHASVAFGAGPLEQLLSNVPKRSLVRGGGIEVFAKFCDTLALLPLTTVTHDGGLLESVIGKSGEKLVAEWAKKVKESQVFERNFSFEALVEEKMLSTAVASSSGAGSAAAAAGGSSRKLTLVEYIRRRRTELLGSD